MINLIVAVLPVFFQVIGWFLEKSKASEEAKRRFFEFVKLAGNDFGSVRLMEYGDKQIKWLKENPWKETKNE